MVTSWILLRSINKDKGGLLPYQGFSCLEGTHELKGIDIDSKNTILDTRNSVLLRPPSFVRPSGSDHLPWIMKGSTPIQKKMVVLFRSS